MSTTITKSENVHAQDELLGIPEVDSILLKYSPWPGETVERDL